MELKNYMETIVLNYLDVVLEKYPNCCKCEQCRQDIVMLALNNLPPKYVSSDKGNVFTKLSLTELEKEVQVIEEIAKAIEVVSRSPRH